MYQRQIILDEVKSVCPPEALIIKLKRLQYIMESKKIIRENSDFFDFFLFLQILKAIQKEANRWQGI